jgi:hypothetical protein
MIYFAHPINTYNTAFESRVIRLIAREFPGEKILNPNNASIEAAYKKSGMDVFKKLVEKCDKLICLPFNDKTIGAGKAKEINWALYDKKPCYMILSTDPFDYEEIKSLDKYEVLSVEETRAKLKSGYF